MLLNTICLIGVLSGLWIAIACLWGAIRFEYRPLTLSSVAGVCLAISFAVIVVFRPSPDNFHNEIAYSSIFFALGALFEYIFVHRFMSEAKRRGITFQRLFLFKR